MSGPCALERMHDAFERARRLRASLSGPSCSWSSTPTRAPARVRAVLRLRDALTAPRRASGSATTQQSGVARRRRSTASDSTRCPSNRARTSRTVDLSMPGSRRGAIVAAAAAARRSRRRSCDHCAKCRATHHSRNRDHGADGVHRARRPAAVPAMMRTRQFGVDHGSCDTARRHCANWRASRAGTMASCVPCSTRNGWRVGAHLRDRGDAISHAAGSRSSAQGMMCAPSQLHARLAVRRDDSRGGRNRRCRRASRRLPGACRRARSPAAIRGSSNVNAISAARCAPARAAATATQCWIAAVCTRCAHVPTPSRSCSRSVAPGSARRGCER